MNYFLKVIVLTSLSYTIIINPLAPKTPEILLQVHDEIKHRKNFFCETNAMFLYVFGVAPHDHVVRFHFEPQGNSIWQYFWKKSRKKWQFFFQIQLLYRKRILWTEQSGIKWHKIIELSKYALVHNQNSTWQP